MNRILCLVALLLCIMIAAAHASDTADSSPTADSYVILPTADSDIADQGGETGDNWTLFRVDEPESFSDCLTLATLQGLVARQSCDKIIIMGSDGVELVLDELANKWGATIEGRDIGLRSLLRHFAPVLDGYILCSSNEEDESASVAISLSGLLNACVATEENQEIAEAAGLSCILDVTDKGDKWLRGSEYFSQLNRTIAFEQPAALAPRLVDYAVYNNAYINFYAGSSESKHKKMFDFLDDGALVYGFNNDLGEYETVGSLSRLNLQLVVADYAYNLSTLSRYGLNDIRQKKSNTPAETAEAVHTLCIVMSDGDNLQWILNDFATANQWFDSRLRGSFPIGWGMPPTTVYTAAPMVSWLYDHMSDNDEFVMAVSGLGYTFPSRWSKSARKKMAAQLANAMSDSDLSYAMILDDGGFSKKVLDAFTAQDAIKGLFYIDYSEYCGMRGKILWSNGKPVVSARAMIWANHPSGQIDKTVQAINAASVNPAKEDAYTFLIVHAWSGLRNGELVEDGDAMAAINELVSQLDDHVQLVTPSVFMERLMSNVKGKR